MDDGFAKELLPILIENAGRIFRAGYGIGPAESTMFEVVRLLRSHPILREPFLEMVERTFEDRDPSGWAPGKVPSELTELVAHLFRWPEFSDLATKRIDRFFHGDPSLALGDPAAHIAEAMDDSWQDRDFYRYWNNDQ